MTMDVTPLIPEGLQVVQGYGNGGFTIGDTRHESAVLVLPERTVSWSVTAFSEVTCESLSPLFDADAGLEILLIGCGEKMEFLLPSLRQEIRDRGPVADAMDTGAACRTFNVLLSEGRRVAAALLPID